MKKETIIILLVVTFVGGFVLGAISGIKFYAGEHQGMSPVTPEAAVPQPATGEELARLEAMVEKEPRNLQALIALGNLYFDSAQPVRAIDAYERALAIDPRNPDVRTDLGIMYRTVKNYDKAVVEFREAARLDPKHKNSRFNLALTLQEDKKDFEGAIAAWQDFLRVAPSGEQAAHAKAQLEQLKGLAK
jgi:cytochrome c-type biogenesis protein CcmH/NrfG